MTEQAFEKLIDDIYEVPVAPEGWMSVAPALQEHLGAPVALFVAGSDHMTVLGNEGPVGRTGMHDYADHLWREDRAMAALQFAPPGQIIVDSSLISDRERRGSRFYNDLLGAHGLERGLYASIARTTDDLMFVAAQRSARVGDYDVAEISALRRLVPHLNRSYRTWLRIRNTELHQQAALNALEHITLGFALVDAAGKLHFANSAAEEEIRNGVLALVGGRVTARSPTSAQALRCAFRAAAQQRRPVAERVLLRTDERAFSSSILVAPVRNGAVGRDHKHALAMLLISRNDRRNIEEESISDIYGLTPAEGRLLAALVQGERLPDYARRHGVAVSTARTHLQALFDKMGERRQADLVRRAVSDPLLRAAGSTACNLSGAPDS